MDIFDRIVNGDYVSKAVFPDRVRQPQLRTYIPTDEDIKKYHEEITGYAAAKEQYEKDKEFYYSEKYRLEAKFKADLEEEAETSNSPKKDLLYSIVDEDFSHMSRNLEHKAALYMRLSELIK